MTDRSRLDWDTRHLLSETTITSADSSTEDMETHRPVILLGGVFLWAFGAVVPALSTDSSDTRGGHLATSVRAMPTTGHFHTRFNYEPVGYWNFRTGYESAWFAVGYWNF